MDMTELRRVVKTRFGDDHGILIDDTDIVDFTNEAVREIVRSLKTNITTTNSDAGYVALDNDQISVESVYVTSTRRYLKPTSFEDIVAKGYDVNYVDDPQFYYVREWSTGRIVHPWPVPPTGTFLTYNVSEFPADVTTSSAIGVPVVYHNDIVNFVLARCHEKNQNYQAFKLLMDDFNSKVSHRFEDDTRVEQEGFAVIRDDPYDYEWAY